MMANEEYRKEEAKKRSGERRKEKDETQLSAARTAAAGAGARWLQSSARKSRAARRTATAYNIIARIRHANINK